MIVSAPSSIKHILVGFFFHGDILAALRKSDLFLKIDGQLMGGSIELSTLSKYKSGLNKFNVFLGQSGVAFPLPSCLSSSELRSLISQPGVIEAFSCFCFSGVKFFKHFYQ